MTSLDGRKLSSAVEEAALERGRENASENDQETTGATEAATATEIGTGKDYATGTEETEGDTGDKSSAVIGYVHMDVCFRFNLSFMCLQRINISVHAVYLKESYDDALHVLMF